MRHRRRKKIFRTGHAYEDIEFLLSDVRPKGLCLDLPVGKGPNVKGIATAGFGPVGADLYPENAGDGCLLRIKADFTQSLPFRDETFAAVLCSEGIEHCSTQLQLIREFWRVLKPGGTLVITTPNILNLRARVAYMLNAHRNFKNTLISEAGYASTSQDKKGGIYIGHVFLVSYFVLRFMLRFASFSQIRITSAKYSASSVLLTPLLWLPVRLATMRLINKRLKKKYPDIRSEMISHIMSADMLYGKKLIVLAQK